MRVLRQTCEVEVLREAPGQQPWQRGVPVPSVRKGRQSSGSPREAHQELSQRVSPIVVYRVHALISAVCLKNAL